MRKRERIDQGFGRGLYHEPVVARSQVCVEEEGGEASSYGAPLWRNASTNLIPCILSLV